MFYIQPLIFPLLLVLNHLNTSDSNERFHFGVHPTLTSSGAGLLDTPVAERMYIERDEIICVRVESDEFYDDEPGPPKLTDGVQVKKESKRPPYTVCVSSTTTFVVC
jgi:DNA-directed RNA polymerase III subunit RPC8